MECIYCRLEQRPSHFYCIECGMSFYEVRIGGSVFYLSNNAVKIPFKITNNGTHPIALSEIRDDRNKEIHKYDLNEPSNMIASGEIKAFSLALQKTYFPTLPAPIGLQFIVYMGGDWTLIPPEPLMLDIYETPEINSEVKHSLIVSSFRGYALPIDLWIGNESRVEVQEIKVLKDTLVIFSKIFKPEELVLDTPGQRRTVNIDIAKLKNMDYGSYNLLILIKSKGLQDKNIPISIEHLGLPDLKVSKRVWLDKGFSYEEIDIEKGFSWVMPHNLEATRELLIETKGKKNVTEEFLELQIAVNGEGLLCDMPIMEKKEKVIKILLSFKILPSDSNRDYRINFFITDKTNSDGFTKREIPVCLKSLKAKTYPNYIGLDFGTTTSCISLIVPRLTDGGRYMVDIIDYKSLQPLPLDEESEDDKSRYVPSAFWSRERGNFKIGRDAEILQKKKIILKRFVYLETPIKELDGKTYRKVTKLFIAELFRRVIEYLAENKIPMCIPDKIRMSVPTVYLPYWKECMKKACEDALRMELKIENPSVSLIDESFASLRYYIETGQEELPAEPCLICVYDFGGGTTDVTMILVERPFESKARSYKVIATGGNAKLGGIDIDSWIAEILKPYLSYLKYSDKELDEKSEYLKKLLGSGQCVTEIEQLLQPTARPKAKEIHEAIRKKIFDNLEEEIRKIFIDIFDLTDKKSGSIYENISLRILLAGNSSRLNGFVEIFSETVKEILRSRGYNKISFEKISLIDKPKACVSIGAFLDGGLVEMTQNISTFTILVSVSRDIESDNVCEIPEIGQKFLKLISRGEECPYQKDFDIEEFGKTGKEDSFAITLYSQFGTEAPSLFDPLEITRPKGIPSKTIRFLMDINGQYKLEWLEA